MDRFGKIAQRQMVPAAAKNSFLVEQIVDVPS
jgi:hypothetical protein